MVNCEVSLALSWSANCVVTSMVKRLVRAAQGDNELHKPIIRKFKKRKVHSSFKDNVWDVDLPDMQLISKHNKGIRYFYMLLICSVIILGLFF